MVARRTHERNAETYPEDELRYDEGEAPDHVELSAAEAATIAVRHVAELTRKDPLGITSVQPTEDGWSVEVEVIEEARIPSSCDMLGLYTATIDLDGTLLTYRRTQRYARGRTIGGE